MKTKAPLVLLLTVTVMTGCAEKKAAAEKARQDAEAKARADAAKKEMETLPKAFRPNYYGKRLQPGTPQTTTTTTPAEQSKKP